MKQLIKSWIKNTPYYKQYYKQVVYQVQQWYGESPAGHYYSPIPDRDEIIEHLESLDSPKKEIPGVDLNQENQFKLLKEYREFYKDLPFPEKQEPGTRYYYENDYFGYADAIFLYSFLMKHKPKRIIEVGSGFSSAVMLDTIERFFSHPPEITFIEPYPDRLYSLMKNHDIDKVRILDMKVQKVPSEVFHSLESGDLLFIDSSHVMKCGNDLQVLFFNILPFLPPGIFVHFHDIFYPFEYPAEWLKMGRYWNESYFLRAFLSYNSQWTIYFWNPYVSFAYNDFIKKEMPLCLRDTIASLYIQRAS